MGRPEDRQEIVGGKTVRTYRQGPLFIQHIGIGHPNGTISGGQIEFRRFFLGGIVSITRVREIPENEAIRASWQKYKEMWREEFFGDESPVLCL